MADSISDPITHMLNWPNQTQVMVGMIQWTIIFYFTQEYNSF